MQTLVLVWIGVKDGVSVLSLSVCHCLVKVRLVKASDQIRVRVLM